MARAEGENAGGVEKVAQMPLFPLAQPLLPSVPLNLQIFERRYLDLVARSAREHSAFGIVPILAGNEVGDTPDIHPWGTLVTLRDWRQLPNGLLGVTVQGERRLRVVGGVGARDDGLIVADVAVYPADDAEPVPEQHRDMALLLRELASRAGAGYLVPDEPMTVSELSWRLPMLLPLGIEQRLALLEDADPLSRLSRVRRWLIAMANR